MLKAIYVLIVSAMPFSELRGGIPLALSLGFDPFTAFVLAFTGNIIPIPIILLFLEKLKNFFCRWKFIDKLYRKIEKRTLEKKKIIEKYGYLGLTFFVAIPFPVTGAWTGALLAFLLNLSPKKSFIFISSGVFIAGIIVTLASMGVLSFLI